MPFPAFSVLVRSSNLRKTLYIRRESPARGGSIRSKVRYALVDIERLRPHEETRPALLEELAAEIRSDGVLKRPVLVESSQYVILDGHHRWEALRLLGCRRIPVYLVDYEDESIELTTWPDAVVAIVTKAEVLDRGVRGDRFPPKTTRHILQIELSDRPVPLGELR